MPLSFTEIIDKSRFQYFEKWNETSQDYNDIGLYEFLSNPLISDGTTLEIGCGAGFSTIQISKKSNSIISVDENPNCVNSSYELLKNNDINVSKQLRGEIQFKNEYFNYEKKYSPIEKSTSPNLIIEGDILVDFQLTNFLLKKKFDNITCWLIGGFPFIINEQSQVSKGRSGTRDQRQEFMYKDYKIDIYEKVAKLGSQVLNKDGKLFIADRIWCKDIASVNKNYIIDEYMTFFKQFNYVLSGNDIEIFDTNIESKIALTNHEPEFPKVAVVLLTLKLA